MRDDQEAEPDEDSVETEITDPEAADSDDVDLEEEPAQTDTDEEKSEETEDGLSEGDFILLDYTIKTVEDDMLVDTTDEAVAEENDVDKEGKRFEPRTVALGAGHVFGTVEEDIYEKDVGDSGTVIVDAVDAFGEYDPSEVRTISAERIPEDDRHPGGHVDIDGQHGHVETIIGGRARVDFNHPLAGEDLEYSYEIIDVVTDRLERARGLFGMYLNMDPEMHIQTDEVEESTSDEDAGDDETEVVELETLYITATPQLSFNDSWLFGKQQIAREIISQVGVDRIIVQEILEGGSGMGDLGDISNMIEESGGELEADADDIVSELEEDLES